MPRRDLAAKQADAARRRRWRARCPWSCGLSCGAPLARERTTARARRQPQLSLRATRSNPERQIHAGRDCFASLAMTPLCGCTCAPTLYDLAPHRQPGAPRVRSRQPPPRWQYRRGHHRQPAGQCAEECGALRADRGLRRRQGRCGHRGRGARLRGPHLRGGRRHQRVRQAADDADHRRRDRGDRERRKAGGRGTARHRARRRPRACARRAISAWRRRARGSACRRSSSASFRAPAAPSGCRASSASRRRSA